MADARQEQTLPPSGAGDPLGASSGNPRPGDGPPPAGAHAAGTDTLASLPPWIGSMDLPGMDESGLPD